MLACPIIATIVSSSTPASLSSVAVVS